MADMFERHEMWDKAMEKYTSMATTHKILSLVGWKARLAKGRLVLSHNQGTLQDMKDVHGWLSEMVEHNTPGDKSIEPFEMLGRLLFNFDFIMIKLIHIICRCMLRVWKGHNKRYNECYDMV